MKENSETFKFQLLDLRLDILNRGVLILLFLTGFLGMATTPFETENTPALLVYAAILALSFASGYLSWMGQQRAPLWLSAWGTLVLSVLLVVAAQGRISPLWISVTCALPLLLIGPRGGWGAVIIASASLGYITLTRPATVPFPLAIEAVLLAVIATFFANVAWQVMCETLNWMSEGYELAFKQSDELRTKSAELENALKSLGQTSFALARANEQLGIMVKFAEDARRSKQEFAANISHELRTPLNLIIGFSDVILNAPSTYYAERLPPKLLADIQTIHRNAQHLSSLVNDILDLSQMDVNYMTIVREPLHMDEFIHSALDDFMPLVTLRGLSLQTNVEPDLPEIYADRTRIRQVLLNLLNNALRFTDAGGITIYASSRRSAMPHQEKHPELLTGSVESARSVQNRKSEIVISVTDTGTGITPDDLHRIFEPFTQVDNSIRRKHGGSGLGLTISKRFVELHGGQMWVESTPGIGSTFYFSLPVTPPAHAISIESTPQQVRRYEVGALAVVEQNPTLSRLLERHLEGITITHTSSVDELVEIAKTNCPEAVLMNEPIESALLPDHWPSELKQTPIMHCYLAGTTERILASISQHEQMADQGTSSAGGHVSRADDSVPNRLAQQRYFLPKPIMREQFYEMLAQMLASDVATTPPHLPLARGGEHHSPLLGKEGPGEVGSTPPEVPLAKGGVRPSPLLGKEGPGEVGSTPPHLPLAKGGARHQSPLLGKEGPGEVGSTPPEVPLAKGGVRSSPLLGKEGPGEVAMSQEPGNDDNAPGANQDEGFSQPARILVVEDDIDTLHLFGRLLRLAPLETELPYASIAPIEAHDGEEAIAFLHTLEEQSIDGILLDMQLGAVSGFDVLRDMEMDERLRRIPVCMITGGELHDEPLVTPYLALTCQDGLTTRELTQAIAALMPIVLPGLNVRAQDAQAKDARALQPNATPQSIEPR